jgi:hypothetical protein
MIGGVGGVDKMEWRRRNRNTFARGLGSNTRGRRYADLLPIVVDKALDATVAYYEERKRVIEGGSSEARLERREKTMRAAIARLEEK